MVSFRSIFSSKISVPICSLHASERQNNSKIRMTLSCTSNTDNLHTLDQSFTSICLWSNSLGLLTWKEKTKRLVK